VLGAFGTGIYEVFEFESSLAEENDVDESDFGGSDKVGLPLSRGVNNVLLPEARNMPPLTRLGLELSLACLASLNEFGLDGPLVKFADRDLISFLQKRLNPVRGYSPNG